MLSIYIHIPFCLQKCNYCNYVSSKNFNKIKIEKYLKCLQKEIEIYAKIYPNEIVKTIFFGGGTPTVLETFQISQLLNCIKNNFTVFNCFRNISNLTSVHSEISIEVNPSKNIDFESLQKIGFNRISIGVQSFNNSELEFLGRLHSSDLAIKNIKSAQKYFKNINIDLLYSFPNQTLDSLKFSLEKAMELNINHISVYNLFYEEDTKLFEQLNQKIITPINEDLDFEMYNLICAELEKNGLKQYEVSNFAKENFECKHNLNYWKRGNYLGFGLGSHSLYCNKRFNNSSDFSQYCSAESIENIVENEEFLTIEQIKDEEIFLGLRSVGVELEKFNEKQKQTVNEIIKFGYGEKSENKFVLNSRGKFIVDEIVLKLV